MNSGVRVLLVEDSRVLAERLAEVITQVSHLDLVSTVDTEAAALAVIARESIDNVVLDLHLKLGTGFGVLRGLAGRVPKPLVIVLTNYSLPEYNIAATTLGATYFLDKARDYERLPAILNEICAMPRLTR
jgi:two-component system, OmpR family, response regulator